MDYPILRTDAMRARQAIAAWWLSRCRHVIEIGGWDTAIDEHLARVVSPPHVTVVDPLIEPSDMVLPCGARHRRLRMRIEDYAPRGDEDGFCLLGAEGADHLPADAVRGWLLRVRRAVVEAAAGYAPGQRAISALVALPRVTVAARWTITCAGPGVPAHYRYGVRELYALTVG